MIPRVDNSVTPETDTAALLAELVRLQAENNKLSKRQISQLKKWIFSRPNNFQHKIQKVINIRI